MRNLKGNILLLITTLLWGLAFTAQSAAADNIGSFTFNFVRCLLAAVFLAVVYAVKLIYDRINKKQVNNYNWKRMFEAGFFCGFTMFFGMNLQQFGIAAYPVGTAAAGRAGFLTATYVVMIPVFQRLRGKKLSLAVILGVIGCMTGMYLLCMSGGFSGIYLGDILVIGCAIGYTAYILVVDKYSDCSGIAVSIIQFIVCGIMCMIGMFFTEKPDPAVIADAWLPVVYAGVVSSGIGYTLQIIGQKYAEPTVASIIMSLESVFAALFGWVILSEMLSIRELAGCGLVFFSVIAAQIPDMVRNSTKKSKETQYSDNSIKQS